MTHLELTRQELYELVWSTPILTLAKKYALSDGGIRKVCMRMLIPLPKVGHWQKIHFGKKIHKTPLTSKYEGKDTIVLKLRDAHTPYPVKGESPLAVHMHQLEKDKAVYLIVPDRLTNPHALIVTTKNCLTTQKPDAFTYIGAVCSTRDALDVRVNLNSVPRTLLFLDTLLKALQARGHEVFIRNRFTYATVEGHNFKILLREKNKKVTYQDGNWDRTVYHPTGILSFQIYGYPHKEWKDGKISLEMQLLKIIAHLELLGLERKAANLKHQKQEEERKAKEMLQRNFEKQQEEELTSFKKLLSSATRWHKATNLRQYIEAVEEKAMAAGGASMELKAWLEWAHQKADWYDPFIEKEDPLLNEVDKETLALPKQTPYYGW